ncbi:conserved hypothetical protein [Ricinus communis]|uniref:Uncharacterized protein n=1 Tax=Ricinus communis TaxID=3988 RepID=B9T006_RICCO|nr:conserved hypothetical protein [Ricinus communis]
MGSMAIECETAEVWWTALTAERIMNLYIDVLAEYLRRVSSNLDVYCFKFAKRTANSGAHALAHYAQHVEMD